MEKLWVEAPDLKVTYGTKAGYNYILHSYPIRNKDWHAIEKTDNIFLMYAESSVVIK